MKPLSSDGEIPAKKGKADPAKPFSGPEARESDGRLDKLSSGSAPYPDREKTDQPEGEGDPVGEALLEMLRRGDYVRPEDIPDIFSPEEQSRLQAARLSLSPDSALAPPSGSCPASDPVPGQPASDESVSTVNSGDRARNGSAAGRSFQAGSAHGSKPAQGPEQGPGLAVPPINPRWGNAGGTGIAPANGGAGTAPGGAGGAWVWLPEGLKPPKSWPRRHPILFWGGCILLLLAVFAWGRKSVEEGALGGSRIAVINVEGVILDASSTNDWIEKIRRDDSIKGAVLRVNSPGGAVGPSQEIFAALKRLDKSKPVIASMGALAASGGYYLSLGAREIYAGPSSLTASIGVKMQLPNFGALMKNIGISETTLTTGGLKDAGSSWRGMTPEEEDYLRALIGDMYDEFIQTVARERRLPLDKVRGLADGRAMTGRQALEAKLVDKLGDRHDAVRRVMELCRLPESSPAKIVEGPEKTDSLLMELVSGLLKMGAEQVYRVEQPLFMY